MILQHTNWRTVEEWKQLNVPISTPSNEASKMFDASLSQVVAHYNDPTLGGIPTTMEKMLQADPEFVMGQAMALGLQILGGATYHTGPELKHAVDKLMQQAETQPGLAPSEKKHAKAVQLLGDGYMKEACMTWEDILLDHPHDILALKNAYIGYIHLGDSAQLRDSVARVLPHWSVSTPYYGYLLGMHAFGLEETNIYDRSEKLATKALEMNRHEVWSTHTLSHVYEMTGQQKRGIQFLDSTVNDWQECGPLACHNWWHCALHHVELGNYQEAMEIYENQVKTRCLKEREMFNVVDSASLLLRLEMQGVDVSEKWKDIQDVCQPHMEGHQIVFNDLHIMMACTGAGDKKAAQGLLDSLEQMVRNGKGTHVDIHSRVGIKVCEAIVAYREGDFAKATELVYPIRYQLFTVGGSNAQRDVFNQFLIMSAIQSSKAEHHRLARTLLMERKALKENSPLTDRLMERVMALHSD